MSCTRDIASSNPVCQVQIKLSSFPSLYLLSPPLKKAVQCEAHSCLILFFLVPGIPSLAEGWARFNSSLSPFLAGCPRNTHPCIKLFQVQITLASFSSSFPVIFTSIAGYPQCAAHPSPIFHPFLLLPLIVPVISPLQQAIPGAALTSCVAGLPVEGK